MLNEYLRAARAANPGAIREGRKSPQIVRAERKIEAEQDLERGLRKLIEARALGNAKGVDLDGSQSAPAGSTATPKKTRTPRTRAADDPLDAQFRNEQELRQLQLEESRAKEQVATSATARADIARQALALEAEMRRKDIDEAVRKKTLTGEEADARRKIIDNLYGAADEITVQGRETAYQLAISREEQERIARLQTDAMRDEPTRSAPRPASRTCGRTASRSSAGCSKSSSRSNGGAARIGYWPARWSSHCSMPADCIRSSSVGFSIPSPVYHIVMLLAVAAGSRNCTYPQRDARS